MGLLGLLYLLLPGSLRADTIFTYTGNAYTDCSGVYTCTPTPPALSITFETTLTGTQLDNLTLQAAYPGNPNGNGNPGQTPKFPGFIQAFWRL
jgi:hypothetical protein